MTSATAAAYLDEPSVEAFLRRCGTLYPRGRKVSGRGMVWKKSEIDQAIGRLMGAPAPEPDAADTW